MNAFTRNKFTNTRSKGSVACETTVPTRQSVLKAITVDAGYGVGDTESVEESSKEERRGVGVGASLFQPLFLTVRIDEPD